MFNNLTVPNPTNQNQAQIMRERVHPFFAKTQVTCQCARKTSRSQEIETRSFHEKLLNIMERISHAQGARKTRSSDDSKSVNVENEKDHDKTGTHLVCHDARHAQGASQTRSSHENTNFNVGDETNHDRTETPVVCHDASHAQGHEQSMLNEIDINTWMPHSVVKQAENSRVRELVKKIENHPHMHSFQRDLLQNKAHIPFITTTKKMIQYVGNVELFELFEMDPKTQCKECLSSWSEGIVYCTYGHLLKESEANRSVIQCTFDLLSIPNCVTKKGRLLDHSYGKLPEK